MTGENTDFWLATSTIGSVMFLAIGALFVDLDRERRTGYKRPAQKVLLTAVNVAFIGTLLPTITAILSLAWRSDVLPPKLLAVVIVAAVLAFWVALVAHFRDVEETSGDDR